MVTGILQARMGSSRLAGKVLLNVLDNKPMLALQIERLLRSKCIDKLVIATTINSNDDPIEQLALNLGLDCYRGSEEDVLDRYYQAAILFQADYVVRLTGDDPLSDPALIDEMINKIKDGGYDAVTNTIQPTYPEGLDASVVTFSALEESWKNAKLSSQREHVTPYIFDTENKFQVYHYKQANDYSSMRWTVDYNEDLNFITAIYKSLYSKNNNFTTQNIYDLLETSPELKDINSGFVRNEGFIKSLKNDEIVN